jgi:hypothetical protein
MTKLKIVLHGGGIKSCFTFDGFFTELFLYLQNHATLPDPEPDKSSPQRHIPSLYETLFYCPPTYDYIKYWKY